jgi:BASS family bile acid:Na+ symporter
MDLIRSRNGLPMSLQSPIIEATPILETLRAANVMTDPKTNPTATTMGQVSRWLQLHFVYVLMVVFVIAYFLPALGQYLQSINFGKIPWLTGNESIKIPNLLLAGVLFNAGLKMRQQHFHFVLRQPRIVLVSTLASWVLPVAYLLLLAAVLPNIDVKDRAGQIWLGLVMAAAMPAANAAAAWTQNAEGNVILCLALVVVTTLISPFITPLIVKHLSNMVLANLQDVSDFYPAQFMLLWVLWPSLLGWLVGYLAGPSRIEASKSWIGIGNSVLLASLNYVNASVALSGLKSQGDFKVVAMILTLATILCVVSYAGAIVIARWLTSDRDEKVSIVYAVGMKNVGVALLLVTQVFDKDNFKFVGVVLICYVLIQHFIAGLVQSMYLCKDQ